MILHQNLQQQLNTNNIVLTTSIKTVQTSKCNTLKLVCEYDNVIQKQTIFSIYLSL